MTCLFNVHSFIIQIFPEYLLKISIGAGHIAVDSDKTVIPVSGFIFSWGGRQ